MDDDLQQLIARLNELEPDDELPTAPRRELPTWLTNQAAGLNVSQFDWLMDRVAETQDAKELRLANELIAHADDQAERLIALTEEVLAVTAAIEQRRTAAMIEAVVNNFIDRIGS